MAILKIKSSVIKAVVFDFDGTLAKLNIDFQHMRDEVLKIISSYGIAPKVIKKTHFVLEMINVAAEIIKSDSEQKSKNLKNEALNFIENMEVKAAEDGELFPKTRELLTFLELHNISTAVVSRNCEKAIFRVFPDILLYCDAVVCRDIVANVKPNPQHLNTAMDMLKVIPTTTLMIGDHPLDIETGRRAGTLTAGVLTGHHRHTDFSNAGADLVLTQASDLIKMIE